MAQRQFRSDDTSRWREGFGKGTAGNFIVTSNTTAGGGNLGVHYGSITGTSGATTATVPSGFSWLNKPCLIHQSQKTGAGNWELNVQIGISGTTATFKYPLQNNYTSGAQIVTINDYKNLTVNSGVTASATAWNGSTGGIIALMAKDTITINGTVSVSGKGFRGGNKSSRVNRSWGYRGEGHTAVGDVRQREANGNGAGAGNHWDGRVGGGGGGGHASAGTNGQVSSGSSGDNGLAGAAVGAAALTSLFMGGGGGASGMTDEGGDKGAAGGTGGGIIFIISKNITITGAIVSGGANGVTNAVHIDSAGSGAGAGGSVLIKSQVATLGTTKITAPGGVGGGGGVNGGDGGAGSVGRIHLDYSKSYSGSTSPGLDVRQDNTIKPRAGGANYYQYFL